MPVLDNCRMWRRLVGSSFETVDGDTIFADEGMEMGQSPLYVRSKLPYINILQLLIVEQEQGRNELPGHSRSVQGKHTHCTTTAVSSQSQLVSKTPLRVSAILPASVHAGFV